MRRLNGKLIKGNGRLALFGAGLFAGTLLMTAPASLAAPLLKKMNPVLNWTSIEGTLWKPTLYGVTIRGTSIGKVNLAFRPKSIFSGMVAYGADFNSLPIRGQFEIGVDLSGAMVAHTDELYIGPQFTQRFALLNIPLEGSVWLSNTTISLKDGACGFASGAVLTDLLKAPSRELGLHPVQLSGDLSCDEGQLNSCLLYTSPSPRDRQKSRMPSSA